MIDYRLLLVMVVSGVYSAAMVGGGGHVVMVSWNAFEAPGVDPEFICHHLKVNPLIAPKKQPPRRPSKEHAEAVREEVTRLK